MNTLTTRKAVMRPISARPRGDDLVASRTQPPAAPALYVGSVRHRRFESVPHAFSTKLFLVCLDVDDVTETLRRLPLWSGRRRAPIRFRRRDYLDGTDRPMGDAVRDLVEARTGARPRGPVRLLTQLRTMGWVFNPISFYFCLSADGQRVETLVLEVTNTPWHQRCWYVLPVDAERANGPWEFPKSMHVSPFLGMDLTYRLRLVSSSDLLNIRLEDRRGGDRVFDADLSLRRVELDRRHALSVPLRHPLLTWRVTGAIHLHALRLWRKGVPIHTHPARVRIDAKGPVST